ncbi:MAG: ABC transporter transmembrane domain-containing protein [Clostridiales bacterium]
MFKLFIKTKWIFNIEPRGKVYFVVKLILLVFTNLFMIIYPILLGYMIDSIFYRNSWKQFINCIFIYTIIFITHQFFNILTEKLNLIIKFNFSNGLKKFFFNRVINAKAIHLSKISSGDLINVINNDSENVHKFYDEIILSTIISYIYILALFIIIIIFSWEIAFSVLFFLY